MIIYLDDDEDEENVIRHATFENVFELINCKSHFIINLSVSRLKN